MALRSYTIGLGLHSLEADQEPGSQMIEAHLSIQHPEYNKPSLANDLMLIKLNKRIRETPYVRPINIASRCPSAGTSCPVSGWGTTSSPQGECSGLSLDAHLCLPSLLLRL